MEKKKVFVIMPFKDEFFEVYEMLKLQFSESFEFSNAGDEGNQQNILKDIVQPIYEADVIIADLTGLNPNVMYELGLAHSFNKKTIIISQDELNKLPFDLKQYRAKDYSTHFRKFAELIEYLKTNLNGVLDNSVVFSNPVNDFLTIEGIHSCNWFEKGETVLNDDSDKGFIDFLADIETNTEKLSAELLSMTSEMNEMTAGTNDAAKEIDRVKKTGGSGTASFVRKQSKKVAAHIDVFAKKLKDHNETISQLWDAIENSILGLVENRFAAKEENKEPLIRFFKGLFDLKKTNIANKSSISGLIESMNNNIGIERSMNQAIRFVEEDLSTYQDVIERMCASIDKILAKARFVVGDVDYERLESNPDSNQQ